MPHITWNNLEDQANAIVAMTRHESAKVCALIEDALDLLANGMASATPQPNTEVNRVKMGLLSYNFGALRCSHLLAQQGYYSQAIGLLRGVYENWLALQFLSSFPDSAHFWLSPSKRPPSHSEMIKALSWKDDKLRKHKEWYYSLCKFAHTSSTHVYPNLGEGGTSGRIGAHPNQSFFNGCAYFTSSLIAFVVDEVASIVADQSWHTERFRLAKLIETFILEENEAMTKS